MPYKERYREIVELIQQNKRVLVNELSTRFSVSGVTIRKDLAQLEQMGLCRRFHRGAVAVDQSTLDIPIQQRVTENRDQKERIARMAVEMLNGAESIILDAGSTTQLIARFLPRNRNMRVVTNSLLVGGELSGVPSIELLLTGGNVRRESQALIGPIALSSFARVHVDIAFVGTMGVTVQQGFTSTTIIEAQGKEAMIAAAKRTVVVADHSKLNKTAFAPFAKISEISALITDNGADGAVVQNLCDAGLQVHCV